MREQAGFEPTRHQDSLGGVRNFSSVQGRDAAHRRQDEEGGEEEDGQVQRVMLCKVA